MAEDPKPDPDRPSEPASGEPKASEAENEQDVGEFINRHVLEKDTVFFEG